MDQLAVSLDVICVSTQPFGSNENKMSDGGRDRASLGVEVWQSSQKWSVQRSAVRSIAWLDDGRRITKGGSPATGAIMPEISHEEQAMFRTSSASAEMECKSVRLRCRSQD